jgi:hypothetical protein
LDRIDLSAMDPVHVTFQQTSSDAVGTKLKGTITILKSAIQDKMVLEWLSNRELYE